MFIYQQSRGAEGAKESPGESMDPLVLGERRIGGTSQRKKSRFSRLGRSLIQSFCSVIIKKAGSVYHYLKEKNKWGELNNKPREVFLKKIWEASCLPVLKIFVSNFSSGDSKTWEVLCFEAKFVFTAVLNLVLL